MDPIKRYDKKFKDKEKKGKEIFAKTKKIGKKLVVGIIAYLLGIIFFLMLGNENAARDAFIVLLVYSGYLLYEYTKNKST